MKMKIAIFLVVMLFISVPFSYAKYEIDKSKVQCNVPTDGTPTQLDTDLKVQWQKPNMSGDDVLHGFVYKWNNSDKKLSDNELNVNNKDGQVDKEVDPPYVTLSYDKIKNDDSDTLRYLHVKTWYLDSSTGKPAYSDDVVIGAINIDNVAPQGTVRIVDENGKDIDSTRNTTLELKVGASGAKKMCIKETNSQPKDSDYVAYSDSATYKLNDTSPGKKTIYVWFKDQAGNVSQATDTVQLLSSKAIDPYEKTIDLSKQTTQTFSVSGTQDKYNWEIINQKPDEQGKTVAEFSGNNSDTNSVTVKLLNPGTFQLKATNVNNQNDVLTSGTITVIKSSKSFNIQLKKGWNLISIPVTPPDPSIDKILAGIQGKYTVVWGEFNPTDSTWKIYNPNKPANTLTQMQPGKGYWIKVSQNCQFSITGNETEHKIPLKKGWNLIGFIGTSQKAIDKILAGIQGKYTVVWGEFNPTDSTWKIYNPNKPANTLTQMQPGKGYWIKSSEENININY